MKFEIKSRYTDAVIYTWETDEEVTGLTYGEKLGRAVQAAIKARANLAGAYLAGANLAGAYLADANLADANLAGANLAGAYLADANLADANLAGAYLAGAYLADANLAGANLADAYLAGAYLADANLADAKLAGAYLAGAYLADANLAGANLADANLADAYLAGANLADAYLAGAKLSDDLFLVGKRPYFQLGPIGSEQRQFIGYITNKGLRLRAGCFFGTRDEFLAKLESTHGSNEHAQEYRAALELIDAHVRLWTQDTALDQAA